MKKTMLLESQEGRISLVWLVGLLILVVAVAAAFFLFPKPEAPIPPPRQIVRNKIPTAPQAPPAQAQQPAAVQGSTPAPAAAAQSPTQGQAPPMPAAPPEPMVSKEGANAPIATPSNLDEAEARALLAKSTPTPSGQPSAGNVNTPAAAATPAQAPAAAPSQPGPTPQATQAPVAATPAPPSVEPPKVASLPAQPVQPAAPAAPASVAAPPKAVNPPETKPSALSPVAGKAAPFTIQCGAYRSKANADKLLADLTQRGYPAFIMTRQDAKNQVLYLVRFGRFATRESAEKKVQEFKEKEKLTAVVAISEMQ
ncbi:MAG: SPOR domain-containing protein [Desulfobacteraceae bacterium]|nr:SPOR domain-containing protein [Desulfobacteraceae bacterium]